MYYPCTEKNALISCAVTVLICAFVFAYAKLGFLMTRLILLFFFIGFMPCQDHFIPFGPFKLF